LLSTLFQESNSQQVTAQSNVVESPSGLLPDWIQNIKEEISNSFNDYILGGDKIDVLINICLLIVIAFLLKNIFGYLQS